MKIRNCVTADYERVCELLAQLWPEVEVNTSDMKRCLEHGVRSQNHKYLCAVQDEEVVGFCSLIVNNSLWQQGLVGHVNELVVDRSHQRTGIGSALLRRMGDVAAEMGCKRVELDSGHHRCALVRAWSPDRAPGATASPRAAESHSRPAAGSAGLQRGRRPAPNEGSGWGVVS